MVSFNNFITLATYFIDKYNIGGKYEGHQGLEDFLKQKQKYIHELSLEVSNMIIGERGITVLGYCKVFLHFVYLLILVVQQKTNFVFFLKKKGKNKKGKNDKSKKLYFN